MDYTSEQIMASMKEMVLNAMARKDISHLGNLLDGLGLRQAVDIVECIWGRDSEQFSYMLGYYNVDQTTVFRGQQLTIREVLSLKPGNKVWVRMEGTDEVDGYDSVGTITKAHPGFVVVDMGMGVPVYCYHQSSYSDLDALYTTSITGITLYRPGL